MAKYNRMSKWFDDSEKESFLPVRAIIAFLFTLGVIGGFFTGKLSSEAFQNLALLALTWYFAKRSILDHVGKRDVNEPPPEETTTEVVIEPSPAPPKSSSAYTPPTP